MYSILHHRTSFIDSTVSHLPLRSSMTCIEHKYSLMRCNVKGYRKKPLLLTVTDRHLSLLATLELKMDVYQQLSVAGCPRRPMLCIFLIIIMVMIVTMTSYVLIVGNYDLLLTPSLYDCRSTERSPSDLSSRDYANIKQVVKNVLSKLEFHSRQIPKLQDLMRSEPQIFSTIPSSFLKNIKNPCWHEEYTDNTTVDPYGKNLYALYSRRFQTVFDRLRNSFRVHLYHKGEKHLRLHCLPYFYIIGQPKCGTTDVYNRLRLHPEVRFTVMKEPHWWTRKRFGMIRPSEGLQRRYSVQDYLDLFDMATFQIQDRMMNGTLRQKKHNIIIGEASASTMWDNNAWVYFYNSTDGEPCALVQDFIHAIQPDAKFIVMLRDPVERLYSDYLYFGIANKSAEDFHQRVSEALQLFEGCLAKASMRSCVYNITLNNAMPVRLHVGLYVVYVLDWLTVFNMEQILVLRLEDHAANRTRTMHKVFDFLRLGPLTKQREAEITRSPASNTRRKADKDLGPMLSITQEILHDFYSPFNQKLAKVLNSDSFMWAPDSV